MNGVDLPAGWYQTTFGELLISASNGIGGKQNKEGAGIPVSRIETIAEEIVNFDRVGFLAIYDEKKIEKFKLKKGDILFSHINSPAHLGKTAIFNSDKCLYHGVNLLRLVVNRFSILPEIFEFYCKLARFQGEFALNAQHAVNQSSLNQKKLFSFIFPLPPLAEQKVIAAKLDELLAQVDSIKTRLDAIPNILKRFRQSVLAAAVSGKLTEDWCNSENEWQSTEINKLCHTIFDGPFGSKLKTDDYAVSGDRVVRLENIGHLKFIEEKRTFISKNKYLELNKNHLKPGDILFSSFVDEEVRVCILPNIGTRFVNKADCFCLRLDEKKVEPKFVMYSLAAIQTYKRIKASVHGATRPRINLRFLKGFELNTPTREEQTEIVRRVEQLFAFADQIEQQVKNAQSRVNNLTQSILAKAFRGELTADWRAQNPELISGENSAEALLARIKAERAAMQPLKQKRAGQGRVKSRKAG